MKMKVGRVIIIGSAAILAGAALWYMQGMLQPDRYESVLEYQLEEARKRADEAVLIRSVSKQMEEIAYQQKELSDRQRMRAERQAQENYRMKLRVEEEWERALAAQQEAENAYKLAESQRRLAEERRLQAEMAKRKADTLAYLTLGRSLGSTALTQYRVGNTETATMLAYSSWMFVKRYGGDTFQPPVFQALSLVSGQPAAWQRHKAGVSSITWDRKRDNRFYTTGHYGEVMEWDLTSDGCAPQVLYAHPEEDFRWAYVDTDNILHVLGFMGGVTAFRDNPTAHDTGKKRCISMCLVGTDVWLLTQDGHLYSDEDAKAPCAYGVTCMAGNATALFAGCADGELLRTASTARQLVRIGNPHPLPVTAVASDTEADLAAWGYEDGTLVLTDLDGKYLKRLVGHRSAITGIVIRHDRLYSCSKDRTLRIWNLLEERTEPVTALEGNGWLLCLALSPDGRQLLAGDSNGWLYRLAISTDDMAATVRERLTRDFTQYEWKRYMGEGVPYETFMDKNTDL